MTFLHTYHYHVIHHCDVFFFIGLYRYDTPNLSTSKQDQYGDADVNSLETSNPIYASEFSDGYATIKDLELFNANENVLYEPGNPQDKSLKIDNNYSESFNANGNTLYEYEPANPQQDKLKIGNAGKSRGSIDIEQ